MKILNRQGILMLLDNDNQCAVEITAPVCIENGRERIISPSGENLVFEDAENHVELTVEQPGDTLIHIRRLWKNTAQTPRKIQTVLRAVVRFEVQKYLIPCISVNGNEFGRGNEPKGWEKDGKKWIFSYERQSIPACTLTENDDLAFSMFVSDESATSLKASCSLSRQPDTGAFVQEIYHPIIEAPLTYCNRDAYSAPYETFIELAPGESFVCGFYLCLSRPRWKNFGICETLDRALEIFGDNRHVKIPTEENLWNWSISYARTLMSVYQGKKAFELGLWPVEGGFQYFAERIHELGFCGQNILLCRMLIEDAIRYNHPQNLTDALEILDTRIRHAIAPNGLMAHLLSHCDDLESHSCDTCNMGFGACEFLRCYERLKEIGIEKPAYLKAGQDLCDFFCDHYSETYGFGKQWQLDGTCIDTQGSTGIFMVLPMIRLYSITGTQKYLDMAEKAMAFYVHRDLDAFVCTAGAQDTNCVDKETSEPFLMCAVQLYDLTGKPEYLEYARKAASYFTSWMMHYQPAYDPDTDIVRYGVCVKGLTSVSVQHHHLDKYAVIAVPCLRRLAEQTGEEIWARRAEMMWRGAMQYISDGTWTVHGRLRPQGSQNEAIFQCRWGDAGTRPGSLNDWLVAWPSAFRLAVLSEKILRIQKPTPQ